MAADLFNEVIEDIFTHAQGHFPLNFSLDKDLYAGYIHAANEVIRVTYLTDCWRNKRRRRQIYLTR